MILLLHVYHVPLWCFKQNWQYFPHRNLCPGLPLSPQDLLQLLRPQDPLPPRRDPSEASRSCQEREEHPQGAQSSSHPPQGWLCIWWLLQQGRLQHPACAQSTPTDWLVPKTVPTKIALLALVCIASAPAGTTLDVRLFWIPPMDFQSDKWPWSIRFSSLASITGHCCPTKSGIIVKPGKLTFCLFSSRRSNIRSSSPSLGAARTRASSTCSSLTSAAGSSSRICAARDVSRLRQLFSTRQRLFLLSSTCTHFRWLTGPCPPYPYPPCPTCPCPPCSRVPALTLGDSQGLEAWEPAAWPSRSRRHHGLWFRQGDREPQIYGFKHWPLFFFRWSPIEPGPSVGLQSTLLQR